MIVFTLVILVLLTFIFTIYINNRTLSNILSVIFFALTIGNIALIVMNDHEHLGMKTVTEEKTVDLVSAAPKKGMNMLLYQQVGTKGKENVYIYKTDKNQKKPSHTKAESYISNKVVTDSGSVKLVRESKYRVYKSDFAKFMFGIADNNHQLVSRKNTFHVNKDWLVLSTDQAKALQKKMKDKSYQASLKTEGAAYVKKAVMAAMMQNPAMNDTQKNRVIKDATQQFQMMKMEELIKSFK